MSLKEKEAKEIYERARDYYYDLRGDERSSDTMLREAELSMHESYKHLREIWYCVEAQN